MTQPAAPIGGGATVAGGKVMIGYGVQFGGLERAVDPLPTRAAAWSHTQCADSDASLSA